MKPRQVLAVGASQAVPEVWATADIVVVVDLDAVRAATIAAAIPARRTAVFVGNIDDPELLLFMEEMFPGASPTVLT